MPAHRAHDIRSTAAFTLIELLVVVAIIALLIGLLLPVLSRARESAQLAEGLSNMRQISIGASNYAIDRDGQYPIVRYSKSVMAQDTPPIGGWCSWVYGGKSTAIEWFIDGRRSSTDFAAWVQDKSDLNEYLYPELTLFDDPTKLGNPRLGGGNGARIELEYFEDPADEVSFNNRWLDVLPDLFNENPRANPFTVADTTFNSYDDVGTSYSLNALWAGPLREKLIEDGTLVGLRASGFYTPWDEGARQIRAGSSTVGSGFVWLMDDVASLVAHQGFEAVPGMHGGVNKSKLAYMDGSVHYTDIKPNRLTTGSYTLLLRGTDAYSEAAGMFNP